jgi:hypothetical protein
MMPASYILTSAVTLSLILMTMTGACRYRGDGFLGWQGRTSRAKSRAAIFFIIG